MLGISNIITRNIIIITTIFLAISTIRADDPCASCNDQQDAIAPRDVVGSTAVACFSDYCSDYGQSRTHNIFVDPGTYSFEVDVTPCSQGTEWYVNNIYQGAPTNDCGCIDPSFSYSFSSGTTTIKALVYYAPDCPGGSWSYQEYHVWNVTIGQPDLTRSSSSINQTTVVPGDTLSVNVTVKNIGSATANSGQLYYYWQKDSRSYTDTYRKGNDSYGSLGVNGTSSESFSYTVPSSSSPGTYYFYYWVDATRTTSESNENNNRFFWTITVQEPPKPDLIAQNASVTDTTVNPGQSITVSWTARNIGTGSAGSTQQGVMWSTNSSITRSDRLLEREFLGSIGSGGSTPESHTVNIPADAVRGQTYYIGVYADYDLNETELNENNNASNGVAVTINPLPQPDLVAQNASVTDTTVNPGQSITVSWSARNIGTGSAGSTQQGVMWSTNSSITRSDRLLEREFLGSIGAGGSTPESHTVNIPADVVRGQTYYIGVYADYDLNETELNENNNGSNGVAVTISYADLVLTDILMEGLTSLPSVRSGDAVRLDFQACNQGTATTIPSVHKRWYWGTSQGSTANLIDDGSKGVINGLSPGECEGETDASWTIPQLDPGTYWITAWIDWDDRVEESDESNNKRSESFVVLEPLRADLVVSDILMEGQTSLPNVRSGDAVRLDFDACNNGDLATIASVHKCWYWGTSAGSTANLIDCGSKGVFNGLSPGECERETDASWTIPQLIPGTYWITAWIDWDNRVPESDESNNKRSESFVVLEPLRADLVVSDILMEGQTSLPNVRSGDAVRLDFEACNQGTATTIPSVHKRWYWGTSQGSTANLIDDGSKGVINGLSPGECEGETDASWTIPLLDPGTYWITAWIDWDGRVEESDDDNNTRSESFDILPPLLADLVVTDILMDGETLLPSVHSDDAVRLDFEACNQGTATTIPSVHKRWYWGTSQGSTANLIDDGSKGILNGLSPGECEGETDASWTIPQLDPGTYWITAWIDWDNRVEESDDDNNTNSESFMIVPAPTRFRGDHFVNKTTTVGAPIRLEAKLEKDSGLHPDIEGEPIYFEIFVDGAWQKIIDDGITLTNLTTDSNGIGSVYYLPFDSMLPSPPSYHIRAVYDGNQSLDATSIPAELTINPRGWSVDPPPFTSEKIPLVLVHGNGSEGEPGARWGTFLNHLSDNPKIFDQFDVYNWDHDSSAAIGFNGTTGNAADLQNFIYEYNGGLLSYYPPGTKILFVAHSRGGLVVRSFMNHANHGNDVLGLITLGTPHHGSPFAVPDWTGYSWALSVGTDTISRVCFNALVNTQGAILGFDVDRLGDLNLAWDNNDGKIAGHLPEFFDVDIANDGALQLTPIDANRSEVTPDNTVFFSTAYKQYGGTLADLNLREAYYSKIVTFAAYDDDLSDNSRLIEGFCGLAIEVNSDAETERSTGLISEHWKLENVIPLLASMSEIGVASAVYYANDGLVPLQSALLLDISGGTVFSSIDGNENVSIEKGAIDGNRLVRNQHIFSGFQDNIRDHLDLLDTENGAYWQALADEIAGFIEGDILVDAEPDFLNATWTLTGPNSQLSGSGYLQIEHTLPGQYSIEWDDIPLYVTPSPNPDTKTLLAGGSLVFLGTYERETGSLQVQITPEEANNDGATWRLTGEKEWQISGAEITLPTGEYTVEFLAINCWGTPDSQPITISVGQLATANGHYELVDCSGLDGDCVAGVCNREDGTCITQPTNEGGFCTDEDVCTETDVCSDGACVGVAIDCTPLDDDCNLGVCNTNTGVCEVHPVNEGGECEDSDLCSDGDMCTAGVCTGEPIDCSPLDDDCNIGVCNIDTGVCEALPINEGATCDDENLCTIGDTCEVGVCAGVLIDCSSLDDDCNMGVCNTNTGVCEAQPVNEGSDCDDGDACTISDSCNDSGNCIGIPVDTAIDCDDQNSCTVDTCDQEIGCLHTPAVEGTPCDDDNTCTSVDACNESGSCVGLPDGDKTCDDGNSCTVGDSCVDGDCIGTQLDEGAECDDSDACTIGETCNAEGDCVGAVKDCDDENECTIDTCDIVDGCESTPDVGAECDDSSVCTTDDSCQADGSCGGTAIVCNDVNVCTSDTCDSVDGCVFTPVDDETECSNGQYCDGLEKCFNGVCKDQIDPCTSECCESNDTCAQCPEPPSDADNDGVPDTSDDCPNTIPNVTVDSRGCACDQLDDDSDGVDNCDDLCSETPDTETPNNTGCSCSQIVCDSRENCVDGVCVSDPCESIDCSDGLFCNGQEECEDGTCVDGVLPCPANIQCDEIQGNCFVVIRIIIEVDGEEVGDPLQTEYDFGVIIGIPVPSPPTPESVFIRWRGDDVTPDNQFDDPIEIPADSNKAITAVFQVICNLPSLCANGCCDPGFPAIILTGFGIFLLRFVGPGRRKQHD